MLAISYIVRICAFIEMSVGLHGELEDAAPLSSVPFEIGICFPLIMFMLPMSIIVIVLVVSVPQNEGLGSSP